ncbi:spermidine synthase [Lactonifactor longoviformis]|uniref:spermidine synthase n=1 Tax=Lactonifactor longoviformis TaxID=341220 RepID=UPI001D00F07C|nr:fused MFS/spermidine synthase [Lactonifactor longoviformis]MCB5713895.1 fused MFS/spermidine synthase [Lactonifactor longoviformis]MCB5717917.1 fused MFS/spermidine synthase [Lactonifactor longoviformis]
MTPINLLKNKYFLYATEFFSGMSVMAVELGASRLLAPYFSSSQVIWTIIIGTIMIAMALGNIWGGRVADKNPDPARLYKRLLLAAVWIAAIPFLGKYLIAAISLGVALLTEKNFLVIASFLSCLIIFVFPLMLLGTVTPSLVKYTVEDLDNNGEIVGRLGALNTIGSILGTFLPTFVTIPTVGTAATFIIFSVLLALLSLLYFISVRKKAAACAVSFLLIGLFSISSVKYSFAFWENDLVYEGESIYNYLQVKENDESVILSTNVLAGVQSIKMKHKEFTGMYYDYALAAPYMAGAGQQADSDILILGLGTGTFASMCASYLDSPNIDGVEIDEKIARLSSQYFDLPKSVNVHVEDGRIFLSNSDKYDVIMVDAYQDITIPFQMSTVEFFTMVKEHLKEDGVMVVNMNMHSSKEGSINDYLCDTIASVFPYAYTAKVGSGTNMELFASENGDMLTVFSEELSAIGTPALRQMMEKVEESLQPVREGSLILTDDKAPVEVLGMRVIDEIIGDELHYYKNIIKEEGLEGLDF